MLHATVRRAVPPTALGLLAWLTLLAPTAAVAQDFEPERARRVLMTPDAEFRARGLAGGEIAASDLASGCVGYISTNPDLIIEVDNGMWVHLRVDGAPDVDTTLVLRAHDSALCNDDADGLTQNPEIVTFLRPGEYFVHVGTKEFGPESPFRLRVSEARDDDFPMLRDDRPLHLLGVSGGPFEASARASECVGFISGRASHILRLRQAERVYLSASSSSDLTLVVIDQAGTVYCNDDARGTLNPRLVRHFPEGLLRIYVGSHNATVNAYYALDVSINPS